MRSGKATKIAKRAAAALLKFRARFWWQLGQKNIVDMTNRLHKRLKELCANHGLTQAALAKRAGVTLSYIGRR